VKDESCIATQQLLDLLSVLRIGPLKCSVKDDIAVRSSVIGRSVEIRQLVDILAYEGSLVLLTGCHGIGKSLVAACVGQVMQKTRTSLTYIKVNCYGVQSLESLVRRLSLIFDLKFKVNELHWLCNWLRSHDQQILLILDNLDLPTECDEELSGALDDLVQGVPKMRLLCTTARQFYKNNNKSTTKSNNKTVHTFHLDNIKNFSHSVFLQIVPDLRDNAIGQLSELTAHVPFAIRLTGHALVTCDLDPDTLIGCLTSAGNSLSARSLHDQFVDVNSSHELQQLKACSSYSRCTELSKPRTY